MASKPALNRAQVRMLKRKISLRNRLTMKALQAEYGLTRHTLHQYYTGVKRPLEDYHEALAARVYPPETIERRERAARALARRTNPV